MGKQLTLEEARKRTEARGFRFLSPAYEGSAKPHRFGCRHGHEWKATPANVWQGTGCPHCAGLAPLTLKEARERTEAKGFRFLSESCGGVNKKHRFACPRGHEWEANPANVWRGHGCPHCAGVARPTLEEARERTEEKGLRWLSDFYEGSKKKHRFGCRHGHEWAAIPINVWRGHGCPHCWAIRRKSARPRP